MSSTTTTGRDTTIITMVQRDEDINKIADETHNYSYCSDHSTSSPMCITPKQSTRTLIDFWSNSHESGMTMSFSHYVKSSAGSSGSQETETSGSIQSLNYSPETSMGSFPLHMKMLLDVTCDDENCNEVTETATKIPAEDLNETHHSSSSSNENDDVHDGIISVVDHSVEVSHQSPEPTSKVENDSGYNRTPTSNSIVPVDTVIDEKYVASASPSNRQNDTTATQNEPSQRSTAALLPPIPPRTRRSNRKIYRKNVEGSASVVTRGDYIAKVRSEERRVGKECRP